MHITQRGNNRAQMFHDAADYYFCISLLQSASIKTRCAIHAYVLMSNHFHLLVTPESESCAARLMQSIGLSYVRYFNHRYERTGTLWEGRYRSTIVNSQRYFFACSKYIELNPVRAQMVNVPDYYMWSSYHHNVFGAPDPLVTHHPLYRQLATQDAERRTAYRALFDDALDSVTQESIRRATWSGVPLATLN